MPNLLKLILFCVFLGACSFPVPGPPSLAPSASPNGKPDPNSPLPLAPTLLSATAINSYEVALNWQNPEVATWIIILRSSNGGSYSTVATIAGTYSAYTDRGVIGSSTYYYQVLASNSVGNSGPSNTAQVTTPAFPSGVLAPTDFTYLGAYPIQINEMTFGGGLTVHHEGGQLRFLSIPYGGHNSPNPVPVYEFKLPTNDFVNSPNYGAAITAAHRTRTWLDVWSPYPKPNIGGGDHFGLWLEDLGGGNKRLWTTHATDYPDNTQMMVPQTLAVRTLNNDGTISNHYGEYGFQNIGQRALFGGVQRIPGSFQAQYGITQPYLIGWGGYTSRMAQGLIPSMGFMAVAIPDVTQYSTGANALVPEQDFIVIADHRSGTTAYDWYASWFPGMIFSFDRGWRNTNVINYFDGGDLRPNPSTPPTDPPAPGARWLSPAPDGKGRWVWGDTFNANGVWIVGPNKQGFVCVMASRTGRAYYMTSSLHADGVEDELQIFNPEHFGEVTQRTRDPVNVQPVASKTLTPDYASFGLASGGAMGAAYDSVHKILWLFVPRLNGGYGSLLVAYRVNN